MALISRPRRRSGSSRANRSCFGFAEASWASSNSRLGGVVSQRIVLHALKPLHWMIIGIVVWLSLAALGLRWVFRPYVWVNVKMVSLCECEPKTLETAQADFPMHVASFSNPNNPSPSTAASDEQDFEIADAATMNWAWRETLGRFGIGFSLWMFSGWFVHWFTGRIVPGPRRKFSHAQ